MWLGEALDLGHVGHRTDCAKAIGERLAGYDTEIPLLAQAKGEAQ